jgi:hypothetical protein
MSTIKIVDLEVFGSDLFADDETYLRDLSDDELGISGGIVPTTTMGTTIIVISTPVTTIATLSRPTLR